MKPRIAIIISPNWGDYARKYLAGCIKSLRKQDYKGEIKIFLTDNETSETSFLYIKKVAPEAEIIRNKDNDGFAKGNNDAIRIALVEKFDYIFLVNMDTVIEPNCVSELVKVAEEDHRKDGASNKIGAAQARLMLWPEKQKINSLGNITHFLGFGYTDGYGEKYLTPVADAPSPLLIRRGARGEVKICYPSGAAVLFKAEVLKKVGLFDEEFWMYNEDQDLGWRIWLAGWKCVLAPKAVVYHKYEFAKSVKQYYWMDRNRIIVTIKNYHILTLLLILPACLIMELGLALFSLKQGWFKLKLKVWLYFLNPINWFYLLKARRESQVLRKVKDKDIVKMFSGKILYQEIDGIKLRIANVIFGFYWKLVKRIIFW